MKFLPVVAKLLIMERRTDRRTDRYDKANSCVSKFANTLRSNVKSEESKEFWTGE